MDIEALIGVIVIQAAERVWSWFKGTKRGKQTAELAERGRRALEKGRSEEAREQLDRIGDLYKKYGRPR